MGSKKAVSGGPQTGPPTTAILHIVTLASVDP
jgi:hypothetical protein